MPTQYGGPSAAEMVLNFDMQCCASVLYIGRIAESTTEEADAIEAIVASRVLLSMRCYGVSVILRSLEQLFRLRSHPHCGG